MTTMKAPRQQLGTTLENGDHLTQPVFHQRYQDHPEDRKFELVGGIVYMASPTRGPHGLYHSELNLVLALYKASAPGVEVADNITVILGPNSEPQPDLLLRLTTECGGQSHYNGEQYLVGPPELVVEIAHSTVAIDMNAKREDYLAAGVQEYLVLCIEEQEIHWWHFPSKRKLKPGKDGLWKSRVFPGLWVDGPALLRRDSQQLVATLQRGLASTDHVNFAQQLQQRLAQDSP
jgi:Uma2 family endonuclease